MRVFNTMGTHEATYRVATGDTATGLAANKLTSATTGRRMMAATLAVETANVRIAIGTDPTQAGLGWLLYVKDVIRIIGIENLANLKYISAAAGVAGKLQILPEY